MNTAKKISIGSIAIAAAIGTTFLLKQNSSSFSIDGSKTKYKAGDTIRIEPGLYTYGEIKNIWLDSGYVYIDGSGVEVKGDTINAYNLINIGTLKGVIISGFYVHNNRYRGIQGDDGKFSNLTFQNIRFDDIRDYPICLNTNIVYDGTDKTVISNIKMLNCEVTRCQQFTFGGGLSKDKIIGLIKGLEIAGNYVHNCPWIGTVWWAGAVEGYDIHGNRIDSVNQLNNNHNGIACMNGSGKMYKNRLSNHQGNLIRAWPFKTGKIPGLVELYENTVFNSRMYSALELQTPPWMSDIIAAGKVTYCNTKVYNNTAINIKGIIKGYDGVMLDLYNLSGGSTEYYNNLGANMYAQKGVTNDMINMGNDKITRKENNIYKATWQQAVTDTVSFKSLIPGVGATTDIIVTPVPVPKDTIVVKPVPTIDSVIVTYILTVRKSGNIETRRQ